MRCLDERPSQHLIRPRFGACGWELTLTNQEPNPDTSHIETIQESLDIPPDHGCIPTPLPFKYTLSDRRDRRIVSSFDTFKHASKLVVVLVNLGRVVEGWWGG